MPDINMCGMTYMQQISENDSGAGLHIEPGIWAHVPHTSEPQRAPDRRPDGVDPTRHGDPRPGHASSQGGPPQIPDNNIIPSRSAPRRPRTPTSARRAGVPGAQPVVSAPRFAALAGRDPGDGQEPQQRHSECAARARRSRTGRSCSLDHAHPDQGGGTANTAFLADAANPRAATPAPRRSMPSSGSRRSSAGRPGQVLQLQYTQLVQLDFNGLRWPHVTVATLRNHEPRRRPTSPPPARAACPSRICPRARSIRDAVRSPDRGDDGEPLLRQPARRAAGRPARASTA